VGRDEAIHLEPLINSILSHWKTIDIAFANLELRSKNEFKGVNDSGVVNQYGIQLRGF
jgi:hypothetical protein